MTAKTSAARDHVAARGAFHTTSSESSQDQDAGRKADWGRRRISPEFAEEVADWLARAGVTLFFAGSTYAAVKTVVVEGWLRVTAKRVSADLRAVTQGVFDFSRLEHLLAVPDEEEGEDE